MRRRLTIALGGWVLVMLALPALGVAAPASVTVRIEGATETLVPRTALRTTTEAVNKDGQPGHTCTGTGAAGALERATGGDWRGQWFDGLGYSVEQIRGETHAFPEPDYFTLWINNRSAREGICGASSELQEGDDMLLFVDRCMFDPITSGCSNPPVLPLGLTTPHSVVPGAPFGVSVVEYASDGTSSPVAGATVDGGDATATTNAAGVATVTVAAPGPATLRATKPNRVRSASVAICATSGSDGACGSVPAGPAPALPQEACATSGQDGRCGTPDKRAPAATIGGIRDGQRFARGKGPRRLRATIDSDPSGLLVVKLRLTRTDRERCSYYSGTFEHFRRMRCGAGHGRWFAVGDRERVDYLLPSVLRRGRYVLDVNVVDKAFNRDDARRRGANRVVFHVR